MAVLQYWWLERYAEMKSGICYSNQNKCFLPVLYGKSSLETITKLMNSHTNLHHRPSIRQQSPPQARRDLTALALNASLLTVCMLYHLSVVYRYILSAYARVASIPRYCRAWWYSDPNKVRPRSNDKMTAMKALIEYYNLHLANSQRVEMEAACSAFWIAKFPPATWEKKRCYS